MSEGACCVSQSPPPDKRRNWSYQTRLPLSVPVYMLHVGVGCCHSSHHRGLRGSSKKERALSLPFPSLPAFLPLVGWLGVPTSLLGLPRQNG